MAKQAKNNEADGPNKNIGTSGINQTAKKALDNRSQQLDKQNPKFTPKKK